jgi:hypothetical protein
MTPGELTIDDIIANPFVPYDIAVSMNEVGYNFPALSVYCRDHALYSHEAMKYLNRSLDSGILAPTYNQCIEWLDSKNLNIWVIPEYYKTGINWNWQILWYLPKEEWGDISPGKRGNLHGGTMQYGDCGEYKTRREAWDAAIKAAIILLKDREKK